MRFDGTTGLRISLVALFRVLCFNAGTAAPIRESMTWTSKSYPDLTSKNSQCGEHIPRHTFLCDPDHLLTKEDAQNINRRLYELAVSTPCQCQRRSQCVTIGPNGNQLYVGFVTAVAMFFFPTTTNVLRFDRFPICKFQLHISPDRITKLYVTEREIEQIQAHLGDLIRRRAYRKALELILDTLRMEYSGAPEEHVDTGTLSLIVSIAVAAILRHLQARGFAFNQSPIINRSPKPLQSVDGRFLPSARASPNFVTKFYPPMDHSIV
ncbi:hypothetical protein D917_03098 [Trichinella nativa]|uniref:Uncharacterized protein n=1 Tax=Trichinella nativa TaxID=6335 RepID=A0A1Y3EF46_9BILA|nr:hypothetical protein D917_03098 [Trichinella nativa]